MAGPAEPASASMRAGIFACAWTDADRSPTSARRGGGELVRERSHAKILADASSQCPMMKWHLDIRDTYRVEIRDLRALLTVVRCGSFTAAAQELGYTQPAVSQQVAA